MESLLQQISGYLLPAEMDYCSRGPGARKSMAPQEKVIILWALYIELIIDTIPPSSKKRRNFRVDKKITSW